MAMNFREGMRRLGAVLGVVGAVGGGYLGYLSGIGAWSYAWQTYKDHRQFESLMMAMPTTKKVIQAVSSYRGKESFLDYANGAILPPAPTDPAKQWWEQPGEHFFSGAFTEGDRVVFVNVDGIKDMVVDPTGIVSSIHFSNGETASRNMGKVTVDLDLVLLLYPILGFLIPWGAIRTMTWIGAGFFQPRT